MHVHGADIAAGVVAPDGVEQRLARVDPVRVSHQKLHQVKLLCCQIDKLPVVIRIARVAVERNMPADKLAVRLRLLLLTGSAAPQKRLDACLELENVKRLRQIIVRAMLKTEKLVHVVCLRS